MLRAVNRAANENGADSALWVFQCPSIRCLEDRDQDGVAERALSGASGRLKSWSWLCLGSPFTLKMSPVFSGRVGPNHQFTPDAQAMPQQSQTLIPGGGAKAPVFFNALKAIPVCGSGKGIWAQKGTSYMCMHRDTRIPGVSENLCLCLSSCCFHHLGCFPHLISDRWIPTMWNSRDEWKEIRTRNQKPGSQVPPCDLLVVGSWATGLFTSPGLSFSSLKWT